MSCVDGFMVSGLCGFLRRRRSREWVLAPSACGGYTDGMSVEPPIPEELWSQVPPAAQAALLAAFARLE